LTRCS
jgi:hypothetical protein